jgi:hypothetical protein
MENVGSVSRRQVLIRLKLVCRQIKRWCFLLRLRALCPVLIPPAPLCKAAFSSFPHLLQTCTEVRLHFQCRPTVRIRHSEESSSFIWRRLLQTILEGPEASVPSPAPACPFFVIVVDQGSLGDHPLHCLFLILLNDTLDSQIRKAIWKVSEGGGEGGRREGQAFSGRTFAQGQSATLPARLKDGLCSRSDKKVITITCHFPLRQTWETKWAQFLGGKLSFALPLTSRPVLLDPFHLMG